MISSLRFSSVLVTDEWQTIETLTDSAGCFFSRSVISSENL